MPRAKEANQANVENVRLAVPVSNKLTCVFNKTRTHPDEATLLESVQSRKPPVELGRTASTGYGRPM